LEEIPWELTPSLMLGSEGGSKDAVLLTQLGVTHVARLSLDRLEVQERNLAEVGIRFMHAKVPDRRHCPVFREHLLPVLNFYRDAKARGGCTLVHCHAGLNRSVAFCVALLMIEEGMTLEDAVCMCAEVREVKVLNNETHRQELIDLARGLGRLPSQRGSR